MATRREKCGLSAFSTAMPSGASPKKISPFASAIASMEGKKPRCAASTVVTMATCGRTNRVSAAISPGAFMPSS